MAVVGFQCFLVLLFAICISFAYSSTIKHAPPQPFGTDSGVNCTFNYGWCGWRLRTPSSHGWLRIQGKEPSGWKGWYIIYNATLYHPGWTGEIASPYIMPLKEYCLEFYMSSFQIAGQPLNELDVTMERVSGHPSIVRFTEHTGSNWVKKRLSFKPSYVSTRLVLSAQKRGNNNGYYAIDNIVVYPRRC